MKTEIIVIILCVVLIIIIGVIVNVKTTPYEKFCEEKGYDGYRDRNNGYVQCCSYHVPNEDMTDFTTECKIFEV